MSPQATTLLKQALELPEDERADLADRLLESLDTEADAEVEAAWSDEIARRIATIEAGTAEWVSWEDLKARLGRA